MERTVMKIPGVIGTTALLLLFGATVPAFAQEEHHEQEAKPAQHEEQAKPAEHGERTKPAKQEEQAKPAKQVEHAKSEKPAPQVKPAKQEEQAKSEKSEPRAKPVKQEQPSKTAGQQDVQRTTAEVRTQQAVPALRLSARGGGRIPDNRFRSNFGSDHTFRIGRPTLVGGYSRFQNGGYWFGFVEPWPVSWYYTDNVYVNYIDGQYFLCNPYYPGTQIAISVVI